MNSLTCRAAVAAILTGLPAVPAWAQEAADSRVLEEIIVTADRREENLQDVSISLSALSADDLQVLGLQDLSQIADVIPGLELRENGLFPGYFIRGAGVQTETNDINEQPVAVYVDEVYLGVPSAQRGQLFDLERVEVLRGPQGTMFGRNSPAGVIHFVTKRPTDTVEGYAQAQFGSYGQTIFEGALNLPLGEVFRARASVKYNKDDGWQEDRFSGENFNDSDILSGRLQLAADFSDAVSLLVKFDAARQRNAGLRYGFSGLLDPVTMEPCPLDRVNAQECMAINGYIDPELDPEHIATDTSALDDMDSWGLSATLSWQINDTTSLTSITAYRELEHEWAVDGDASNALIFGAFNFDTLRTSDTDQFSQEIRIDGSTQAATWVAGVYYYEDSRFVSNEFPSFFSAAFTDVSTESWAAFGQLDYALSEAFSLIGGLRYTDEKKDALKYSGADPTTLFNPVLDDEEVTWKAGAEWRPNDQAMWYASISTGFKSGTFSADANDIVVNPEEATSYELGLKSQFWEGRGRFNATAYYNDYEDFQATGTTQNAEGLPINELVNVGAMSVLGLEADLSVVPADNWEVTVGINLTSGEIEAAPDQASGAADYETGEPFYFDGKDPAHLPEYSFNAAIKYYAPVDAALGSLLFQLDGKYSGAMWLDSDNNRLHRQDEYGVLNARVMWDSSDGSWYASAFVNNLTDTKVRGWSFDISGFVWNRAIVWNQRPRSVGVRVGYRF